MILSYNVSLYDLFFLKSVFQAHDNILRSSEGSALDFLLKSVQRFCRCEWSNIAVSRYFGHWLVYTRRDYSFEMKLFDCQGLPRSSAVA